MVMWLDGGVSYDYVEKETPNKIWKSVYQNSECDQPQLH